MAARDELVAAITGRYAQGDRAERGRILDEFSAVTGFHRKHAMRLLRVGEVKRRSGARPGRRVYDEAVREALIVVWEASDRICGKRLRPLLPILGPVHKLSNRLLIELYIGFTTMFDTVCCGGDRYRTYQRAVFGGGPFSR